MLRVAVGVLAAAVGLALPASAAERVIPRQAAFVLLADGRLVKVGLPDGPVIVRRLGAARPRIDSGPLLALTGRAAYVLLRASVATVDARTLRVTRRTALPARLRHRGLAVGHSGRIYVAGSRVVTLVDPATGLAVEDAVVTVVDPARPTTVATVREAAGKSWLPFWVAVSPDEERIAVAYHGGCNELGPDLCTSGADVLTLGPGGFGTCAPLPPRFDGVGCTPQVHGALTVHGDGFVAATGSSEVVLLDGVGAVSRELETRLTRNHLMTFALDRAADLLYAVGSCRYAPGLTALSVATGRATVLAPRSGRQAVCAERVAVGRDSLLALATRPAPFVGGSNALVLVDGKSGRRLRSVGLGSEPLEVAVGRW